MAAPDAGIDVRNAEGAPEMQGVGGETLPAAIDQVLAQERGLPFKLGMMLVGYAALVAVLVWIAAAPGNPAQQWLAQAGLSRNVVIEAVGMLATLATLITGTLLYFIMARPLAELRDAVPDSSWQPIQPRAITDYAQLRLQVRTFTGEIKALRDEKHKLVGELDQLADRQQSANATLAGAVALTHDSLVLTDVEGRIRDVSPSALEILHAHRADILGKPFADVVRLYDHTQPMTGASPLPDFAARTIERRSNVPQLQQAVLLNGAEQHVSVLVGATAIIDHKGMVTGAMIRVEPYGPTQAAQRKSVDGERARSAAPGEDAATGLPNGETFDRRLEMLINIARTQQARHALLFVAIDNFEEVCSANSHWAGEELLWQIAQLLRSSVGEGAEAFRISTMHFGVLMPFTSPDSAAAAAEKVRVAVEGREFKSGEKTFASRVSIAVVSVSAESEGAKVLLGFANTALSLAKSQGGNRVQIHAADATMDTRRKDDKQWVTWLHRSLRQGRAHIISQSIEPLGHALPPQPLLEVLLRIEDDDGVWITPSTFLPSVVRHNLTAQLDLWMLRRLLQVLGEQPTLVEGHHVINLNIARSSVTEADFAERVVEALNESKVPSEKLCFEVEATVSINHPSDFARFVNTVRPTGARFALDGAKAAMGLNALVSLPVDYVKIHSALIRTCVENPLDQAYVEWINQAVHKLKRQTIATGVENQQTLDLLRKIGVDYAQGVHINKLGPLMA